MIHTLEQNGLTPSLGVSKGYERLPELEESREIQGSCTRAHLEQECGPNLAALSGAALKTQACVH